MLKKACLFGIVSISCSVSFAQTITQTIKGIVIDKDTRRPLAGATVFIYLLRQYSRNTKSLLPEFANHFVRINPI